MFLLTTDLPEAAGRLAWLTDPKPRRDPAGYDSVTREVLWHGTEESFFQYLLLGRANCPGYESEALYFTGFETLDADCGLIHGAVTWEGFIGSDSLADLFPLTGLPSGARVRSASIGMVTEESEFPREIGSLLYVSYLGEPYAPAPGYRSLSVLPGLGAGEPVTIDWVPYRVRLIDDVYTFSLQFFQLASRSELSAWQRPPRVNLPAPPDAFFDIDPEDSGDPLYNYSAQNQARDGWLCRNFQRPNIKRCGDKYMVVATCDYTYVKRAQL